MASLLSPAAMDEDSPNKDLKDVACVVFFQSDERDGYYIYLINVTTQKLEGFLQLDEKEYPSWMGCIVYESMLYMFGGIVRTSSDVHKSSAAYVLDLFQLANTAVSLDNEMKPKPTKLPQMNSGKSCPIAVVVGHLICVFDGFIRANHPPHSHFEVYDPEQKSWAKIQDPSLFTTGDVDAYHVEDNKIFLAFRNNAAIHILDFNDPSSPTWSHVMSYTHARLDPVDMGVGVNYGSMLVCLDEAHDFGDKLSFGSRVCSVVCSGKIANEGYDVVSVFGGGMLRFGADKVCTITPQLVRKAPRRKRNLARLMIGHRKPLFLLREGELPKRGPYRKPRFRLLVNVCSVDISARPIQLEVVKSFGIPMYADSDVVDHGFVMMASLCNPRQTGRIMRCSVLDILESVK